MTTFCQGIPGANQIIGLIFDEVQIEGDDLAYYAPETVEGGRFPLAEIRDFFRGDVFLFICGRVVDTMSEIFSHERAELATPEAAVVFSKIDGPTKVGKHFRFSRNKI